MTNRPSILIAGIGNIFHGDDAFGVELAQKLSARKLPGEVKVVDFGIRGFDLIYTLMESYEIAIILDATPRGDVPGTIYTIEPDLSDLDSPEEPQVQMEGHGMNPMRVFRMVKRMGGELPRILLVGCEPLMLGSEEEGHLGLSPIVAAAVNWAVNVVESLVSKLLNEQKLNKETIQCHQLR